MRKYGVAKNTISLWNHNITTREAVEALMNFSLFSALDKMQSSAVEILKLIESELLNNLTKALIIGFCKS